MKGFAAYDDQPNARPMLGCMMGETNAVHISWHRNVCEDHVNVVMACFKDAYGLGRVLRLVDRKTCVSQRICGRRTDQPLVFNDQDGGRVGCGGHETPST